MVEESKVPVTIVGLRAENFKKITLVEVVATDSIVTVGGLNEAGKSSVLDAVATVLGGADLAPKVPIRKGQSKSTVVATLTDGLKITRTFRRLPASEDLPERVTSTLEIANADGSATFKSPQAMLDKLLGGGAFHDPLAFSVLRPADRREAVRRIVGLDFSVLDGRRAKLLQDRLLATKELRGLEVQLDTLAKHEDAPAEEIDPDAVMVEIEAAEKTVRAADDALTAHDRALQAVTAQEQAIMARKDTVADLRRRLQYAEDAVNAASADLATHQHVVKTREKAVAAARAAVVDPAPVRARMSEIKSTNAKVQHNRRVDEAVALQALLVQKLEEVGAAVATIDQEKRAALEAAPFPVEGMSFSEDDVLLDGLPFAQASTARRLRVSVAMALARAGQLRVLLVKAGNDLDAKNLGLLAEVAREHGAQVWVERVTDDPASVSVFIEDGSGRS